MTKSTKAKLLRTLLLLFIFTLFCCLNGCGPEGGGEASSSENTITLEATPASVAVGDMSVLVATVSDEDGEELTGLTVNFGFLTNNSGATALNVLRNKTDASGTAVATYTAGNNFPSLTIQDTVSASVTGSANAVIISRLPDSRRVRISLTFSPATTATSRLATTTSNCVVKATVKLDDGTTPAAGETVTFSKVTGGGTLSASTATTNNSGEATTVFTAPGGATGEAAIRAQLSGTGGDAVGVIYW